MPNKTLLGLFVRASFFPKTGKTIPAFAGTGGTIEEDHAARAVEPREQRSGVMGLDLADARQPRMRNGSPRAAFFRMGRVPESNASVAPGFTFNVTGSAGLAGMERRMRQALGQYVRDASRLNGAHISFPHFFVYMRIGGKIFPVLRRAYILNSPSQEIVIMTEIIELKLASGRSVYVEAEPVRGGGMREMAGGPAERISKKFDEISETLADVAENLEQQLGKLANGPKKVEVEIHAVVKGGGMLFFAQGSAEGGIKLKLSWER